jgi:putative DNA primase/helicase
MSTPKKKTGPSDRSWLPKPELVQRPDLLVPLLNDYGNSERLIALHGDDLRYCHGMRKWLAWDGRRWKPDTNGESHRRAKKAMLEFASQALDRGDKDLRRFAIGTLNERSITHLLTLAESAIYIDPSELDSHPLALNVRNGTIDLVTGTLRPHRKEDYLTKLVDVDYSPDAQCPRWSSFLGEVLDDVLHDYFQRALGYSLTGITIEKAVFALYGAPNAGKSTLLTTFRELIPEYAVVIQADTLMSRRHETNNTNADLADLRGARFVHTSECESGQRLSQSRLKAITQGMGHIKATRKYENPITFPETHKLWLDTNDRPGIKDVDDQATFNRLHPIPFMQTITKIDPNLGDKLKNESPGILAWAVAGAREWHRRRLDKPAEVIAATEGWRAENDNIGRFIDDCCVTGDGFSSLSSALYASYKQWVERTGERLTVSQREFSNRLIRLGFQKHHTERGERFEHIGLRAEGC